MTTPTTTIRDLCNATPRVSVKLRPGEANDWTDTGAHHYSATLRYKGRRMTVPFHTGSGWKTDPDAADILDCLISDATSYDNAEDFVDWAVEFGYDLSEREPREKARRTYAAVESISRKLHKFLGDDFDRFAQAERL